jgi:heterodisulfide reductase subunit A-like polyferredoxin
MIKFNEEIMKKVEQKEKEAKYIARCLDANICPKCGGSELECKYVDLQFGGEKAEYRCLLCGSKYS